MGLIIEIENSMLQTMDESQLYPVVIVLTMQVWPHLIWPLRNKNNTIQVRIKKQRRQLAK